MLIRAAAPADIPQIMRLAGESETAAQWGSREYDALFAPEAPKRIALVAEVESQGTGIAGFVIARCAEGEWEIENVVVEPAVRMNGIARSLLEELLREASKSHVGSVLLEVRESNAAARELYAKLGFSEQGRRPRYYRNPEEDAVLLKLLVANC